MKTLGIVASKGGTGKTTLAVHLAVAASSRRRSVAILDCDPQGSAAKWWGTRGADLPPLEQADVSEIGAAKKRAAKTGIDLLIIDSAPSHVNDGAAIAGAADFTIIPVRPGIFDLDGIRSTLKDFDGTRHAGAIVLNACPVGRGGKESSIVQEARGILADAPVLVAGPSVSQRVAFSYALIDGRAVTEYEPDGKAAGEINVLWKWISRRLK